MIGANPSPKSTHLGAAGRTTLSAKAMSYIPSPEDRLPPWTSAGRGLLCDRRTPEETRNIAHAAPGSKIFDTLTTSESHAGIPYQPVSYRCFKSNPLKHSNRNMYSMYDREWDSRSALLALFAGLTEPQARGKDDVEVMASFPPLSNTHSSGSPVDRLHA